MFSDNFRMHPEIKLKESEATVEIIARQFSNPSVRSQQAELADIVMKLYELFREYQLSTPSFQLSTAVLCCLSLVFCSLKSQLSHSNMTTCATSS